MKKNKLLMILFSVLLLAAIYQVFLYAAPKIEIKNRVLESENISISTPYVECYPRSSFGMPHSVNQYLDHWAKETDSVLAELTGRFIAPIEIHSTVSIENTNTIVTYQGTVTDRYGATHDFKKELIFDFILTETLPDVLIPQ